MTYRSRRFRGGWHGHREWHSHGGCQTLGGWHGNRDRPDHWPGRGRRGRRFANREELISALEGYQRNLEQRAADVAEKIRRLRAKETAEAESSEGSDATPTTHNV